MDITNLQSWQLWILAALGLLLVFFGYRVKKIAFFILWFVLGWSIIMYLMPTINNAFPDIAAQDLWQWLLPLAGGLLLALMGFSIEKLCVGGACFGLVMIVAVEYFGSEMQTLAIAAVIGVLAAGAAVMLMKPATIIATALAGAYVVALAALQIFPQITLDAWYWPLILGVGAVGSLVQFATTKGK